jgi:hypothetical protein
MRMCYPNGISEKRMRVALRNAAEHDNVRAIELCAGWGLRPSLVEKTLAFAAGAGRVNAMTMCKALGAKCYSRALCACIEQACDDAGTDAANLCYEWGVSDSMVDASPAYCAIFDKPKIMRVCFERRLLSGKQPCAKSADVALYHAMDSGHTTCATICLEYGATVSGKCMLVAASRNRLECFAVGLRHLSGASLPNSVDLTDAIDAAAMQDYSSIIELCGACVGFNVDAVLATAARCDSRAVVAVCIKMGASAAALNGVANQKCFTPAVRALCGTS